MYHTAAGYHMAVGSLFVVGNFLADNRFAGNLVVADIHQVDSQAVVGSRLAGSLVADSHPGNLVVAGNQTGSPLVGGCFRTGSLLTVLQVD